MAKKLVEPNNFGVYGLYSRHFGDFIYYGKTKQLNTRPKNHFKKGEKVEKFLQKFNLTEGDVTIKILKSGLTEGMSTQVEKSYIKENIHKPYNINIKTPSDQSEDGNLKEQPSKWLNDERLSKFYISLQNTPLIERVDNGWLYKDVLIKRTDMNQTRKTQKNKKPLVEYTKELFDEQFPISIKPGNYVFSRITQVSRDKDNHRVSILKQISSDATKTQFNIIFLRLLRKLNLINYEKFNNGDEVFAYPEECVGRCNEILIDLETKHNCFVLDNKKSIIDVFHPYTLKTFKKNVAPVNLFF